MAGLDGGRLNIAACSLGGAQSALDKSLEYCSQRKAFGQTIDRFQALQFRLADMATDLEAARLMVLRGAWAIEPLPEPRPRGPVVGYRNLAGTDPAQQLHSWPGNSISGFDSNLLSVVGLVFGLGFVLSFLVITSLFILFADLVPRRLSMVEPEHLLLRVLGPMQLCMTVFKPIVWIYARITDALIRVLGLPDGKKGVSA